MNYLYRSMLVVVLATSFSCTGGGGGGSGTPAAGGNGAQGVASAIDGAYYRQESTSNDGYTPEGLDVLAEGTLSSYAVHDGHTIVSKVPFTVEGNQIIIAATGASVEKYKCGNTTMSYETEATPAQTFTFQKDGGQLTLKGANGEAVLKEATPAESTRVTSLPKCTKI